LFTAWSSIRWLVFTAEGYAVLLFQRQLDATSSARENFDPLALVVELAAHAYDVANCEAVPSLFQQSLDATSSSDRVPKDGGDALTNVGKHLILARRPRSHYRLMSYDGESAADLLECPVWLGYARPPILAGLTRQPHVTPPAFSVQQDA